MVLESLTSEQLRKKFKNNFDLCNFSINVARNIILSGQQGTLDEIIEMIKARATEDQAKNALKA